MPGFARASSVKPVPGAPASLATGWNAAVLVGIAVSLVGAAAIAALTVRAKRMATAVVV